MATNVNEEGGLSPSQEIALLELLKGATGREAAVAAEVTAVTVSMWVNHDPAFIAAYNAARLDIMGAAVNELIGLKKAAIAALRDLLADDGPDNGWLRLKAAEIVLKVDFKTGPTDPADVEAEMLDREVDRRSDLKLLRLMSDRGY